MTRSRKALEVGGCKRLPSFVTERIPNGKLCTTTARIRTTRCRAGGGVFVVALPCRHRHASITPSTKQPLWSTGMASRPAGKTANTQLIADHSCEKRTADREPSNERQPLKHARSQLTPSKEASSSAPATTAGNHDASAS